MRLSRDESAASPLVVIATFVGAAILVTILVYALAFDRPEPRLQVVYADAPGGPAFEVTQTGGGLTWKDVSLRLLDRAGTDQAGSFLVEPTGKVDEGDTVRIEPRPPSGTYVLLVMAGGEELSRLVVEL